ncbi:NPP1 family protein [Streptomyces sp. NPDC091217]
MGHRHDWECIVVWVKQGADYPSHLSASQPPGIRRTCSPGTT